MINVLIVEDDSELRDSLVEGLATVRPDLAVRGVGSVESAYELIRQAEPELIVSDVRLPGKSGLQLLLDLHNERPQIRFVLMSAYALPETYPKSSHPGLVRFLAKPFTFDEFARAVTQVLAGSGFSGRVTGLSLTDVLQLMNLGRRTGAMTIKHKGMKGELLIRSGELIHARTTDHVGMDAWNEIFSWESGQFSLEERQVRGPATITQPFQFLLLDAAKELDEKKRQQAAAGVTPQLLDDVLVDSERFQRARERPPKPPVDETTPASGNAGGAEEDEPPSGRVVRGPQPPPSATEDPLDGLAAALEHGAALLEAARAKSNMDDLEKAQREHEHLQQQLEGSRAEADALYEMMARLERRSSQLTNLYVATFQLYAGRDPEQVYETIAEITSDILGAERFVLLMSEGEDENDRYRIVLRRGFDHRSDGDTTVDLFETDVYTGGDAAVDAALEKGTRWVQSGPEGPVAIVPLQVDKTILGVLVILKLLEHKPRLEGEDAEILDLLGAHAASALLSSMNLSDTSRKLRTMTSLVRLVVGETEEL